MKIISGNEYFNELRASGGSQQSYADLDDVVLNIIQEIKQNGDAALRSYTEKFDQTNIQAIKVSTEEIEEAESKVSETFIQAIKKAYEHIYKFHANQVEKSWFYNEEGVMLGQKVTPIESVGIYVPGGTAAYPSTVLMNAVPASIAGVKNIAMTTPPQKDGTINPHVLVAAKVAGIQTIYKAGGAQAIAALAYGTETVQKVAKIVGPGNAFVACAKKWVFGEVAIDMIAGPSEICVVADESANPSYVAADLLSQAEHDERATAICVTHDKTVAEQIKDEVNRQKSKLKREEIINQSLADYGRIVVTESLEQSFAIVNEMAPEHLQLMIENALELVDKVEHAGAIFFGNYSPEALGDYIAGPNHTLPTSGTAKFSSPLGVYDFIKRSSIIHYSEQSLLNVADEIMTIANAEGLDGHSEAINIRMENKE
ncbi:MAG TPA: histidinol dehydrogenase [Pseudogracilibacillus sp.]|nr:histidinol dehydrogenase [Pseudogracilibacillus sp.]